MRVQFLSDGSEYRSYGGGNFSKKTKPETGLFWWTIGITLLLGLATASWFFSILVFAHPEKPFNYDLLVKFNKLEGIRKYSQLSVPHGQFLSGSKLLEEFFYFTPEQFRVHNDLLKRHYIRNFKEKNPTYVRGSFEVLGTRKLGADDVFQNGWVVVARDTEIEDVDIELVLPGLIGDEAPYKTGDVVQLDTGATKTTYAGLVHVQRQGDGQRIRATLVPLVYQLPATNSNSTLSAFSPPEKLNLKARWPISPDLGNPSAEAGVQEVAAQSAR
jgi:hypothetical protein